MMWTNLDKKFVQTVLTNHEIGLHYWSLERRRFKETSSFIPFQRAKRFAQEREFLPKTISMEPRADRPELRIRLRKLTESGSDPSGEKTNSVVTLFPTFLGENY
mgnify:CR=1 FL=1